MLELLVVIMIVVVAGGCCVHLLPPGRDHLCCYLDLSQLLRGFVNVVLCIFRPLQSKTKLKFDQQYNY